MAVNSKADKSHRHTVIKGSQPKPSYQSGPAPSQGASVIGAAGTKALMYRAKKELTPLEDPTQPIAD